jgi:hypothetical protein
LAKSRLTPPYCGLELFGVLLAGFLAAGFAEVAGFTAVAGFAALPPPSIAMWLIFTGR